MGWTFALVGTLALICAFLSGCDTNASWECFGDGQAECHGSYSVCQDVHRQCLRKLKKLGEPTYEQPKFKQLKTSEQERRGRIVMAHGEGSGTVVFKLSKRAIVKLKSDEHIIPLLIAASVVTIVAVVMAGLYHMTLQGEFKATNSRDLGRTAKEIAKDELKRISVEVKSTGNLDEDLKNVDAALKEKQQPEDEIRDVTYIWELQTGERKTFAGDNDAEVEKLYDGTVVLKDATIQASFAFQPSNA